MAQNNLLRCMLNIPTAQELVEQLFLAQPKAHQAKYAKISEDVEQDADKLCTFFEGCHIEDVADGTFQILKTSIAANRKATNFKATNFNVEDDISTSYFPPSKKSKCLSSIDYDDDSMSCVHSSTSSISDCTLSDDDIFTANAFSLTHYAADLDDIEFNYHGPKVIPWHETPVTICTAKTIGAVRSRWLRLLHCYRKYSCGDS